LVLPAWLVLIANYSSKKGKQAFVSGWFFGLGYFGAGISWVHVSIATFGGVPLFVSIFLMLLLCSYLALFPAIFSHLLKRYFKVMLWPLAAPMIWLATEWLRAHFLTGFPWLSIAYSQSSSVLNALYPVVGEIGTSVVMILLASVIASALVIKSSQALMSMLVVHVVVVASVFVLSLQQWVIPTGETRTAALVQGNIEQSIRWKPEQDRPTMDKYLGLTEAVWGKDIIVWPEAAVPRLEVFAINFLAELDKRASDNNSALITGIVDVNLENDQALNKLISLGLTTSTENTLLYNYPSKNTFAKHHLLPIGEFVPFESLLRPLAPIFDLPMSSFTRGDYVQENLQAKGLQVLPAICFEIAFPQQIRANVTEQTDLIVTVSNDAWFGDSHGPHQHLEIAKVRAMEFGLPLLRATNTGVTAAFDHQGNLLGQLPQFSDAVLEIEFPLVDGATPYTTFGNIPITAIASIALMLAIRLRKYREEYRA
jgi:apolipoprotein N-acyltransferase